MPRSKISFASASPTLSDNNIPSIDSWPHRPVFVKASSETNVRGISEGEALPLGVPFEFETDLFKGRMLIRLRNATSDGSEQHKAYFSGRKRLMQTVIQGQFKKKLGMDEVYVGSVFREPLKLVPPPSMMRVMNAIISRVAPGVVLDLDSEQPKVITLYAGTAQTLSIDLSGQEPDITQVDIPESTSRMGKVFRNSKHRKKYLSLPHKAAKYQFDTEHVYTLHHYDDAMDYAEYKMKLPMYDYDLSKAIGAQPMTLSAMTTGGSTIFHFDVWHESVYQKKSPKVLE